jgi:AmmeMemoRadiSam system protein B
MNNQDTMQNRPPAVAGQFYSLNPSELEQSLKMYFAKVPAPDTGNQVVAIISPHAGYVFSGEVAAAAIRQVDREKKYKTIFILGSSHRNSFPGASVYSIGNYMTPLGNVETDLETARELSSESKVMAFDPRYHLGEHSIEVQVPFLQYWLKQDLKIVPILLGTQDAGTCEKIAEALKPYFTPDNLFIISTDFSHYPAYNDAVKSDKQLSDAIVTNHADVFLKAVKSCTEKKIPDLSTGCCSWPSVITLMYLTQNKDDISYKQVMYKNSGDSPYGEKEKVVGYNAISVTQPKNNSQILTDAEKKELLSIARNTIENYLKTNRIPDVDEKSLSPGLKMKAGAFVTLKKSGDLRGCIGHFEADYPLYSIVQKMAVASSTQDYRF